MTKFNPLNFIADHAGMNLADAIKEAYEQGKRDAQPEQAVKDCRNCKHGKYNDYHDTYFCYNAEGCSNWDKWETSEQPEQEKGHWVKDGHHIECNKCGTYMCDTDREGDPIPMSFCPNCGKPMERGVWYENAFN